MLSADDHTFAIRSKDTDRADEPPEPLNPPDDSGGWIFIGFDSAGSVGVWAKPKDENAETQRQRLLAEACDALAMICFAADRKLDGVSPEDGAQLLKMIGDGSKELQALIRQRFDRIEKAQKDAAEKAATGG